MNNVDTLFAVLFAITFTPVLLMYVVGIVSEMMDNPTQYNDDMIMPPKVLMVGAITAVACAVFFNSAGLENAATVVFAGTVMWVVANVVLVAVSTHSYAR